MTSPFLGEFLGTMILVLLGNSVVAAVLLKRSKPEGSSWMVITAGWAFAVMAGVFTAIACEELSAIVRVRSESEARVGREATAVHRILEVVISEAISLPQTTFQIKP